MHTDKNQSNYGYGYLADLSSVHKQLKHLSNGEGAVFSLS